MIETRGSIAYSPRPLGIALADEGADAFLGVARQHVLDHHVGGIGVGVGQAHLGLAVKRFLADLQRQRRFGSNGLRIFGRRSESGTPRGTTRLTRPKSARRRGVDRLAGQQHLHRLLARHVARQRHHRRRAEQADIDARRAEGRAGPRRSPDRSWRPVAARRPWPAPSTSAITGLGWRDDRLHQRRAGGHGLGEEGPAAVRIGAARRHFLEIVAGAEHLSGGREHDDTHGRVVCARLRAPPASRRMTAQRQRVGRRIGERRAAGSPGRPSLHRPGGSVRLIATMSAMDRSPLSMVSPEMPEQDYAGAGCR